MARATIPAGGKKAKTHDRIVRAAARAIWRDGYEATSVATVMKDAGLTHGGFYAHFPSRDAMLAEGLARASADGLQDLVGASGVKAVTEAVDPYAAYVDTYLSDDHLCATDAGCTLASLGTETRRQSPAVRKVATEGMKKLARMVEHQAAGSERVAEPLAAMATLVGALVMARIADDPALADEIRASARRLVLAQKPTER